MNEELKRRIAERISRIIAAQAKSEKQVRSEPPVKSESVNDKLKRITKRINKIIAEARLAESSAPKAIGLKPLIEIYSDKRLNEALIVLTTLGYADREVIRYLNRIDLMPKMTAKSIIRAGMIRLEQSPILFDDDEDDEWINQSVKFFRDDLDRRFMKKVMEELLLDDSKPYSIPILLIETERPEIQQLVRKFILFSPHIKPFNPRMINPPVKEGLEKPTKKLDYGKMHILVNYN